MISFLLYLLKSTISLGIFYLVFRLLMRGETNFALGRSLLLTLVLASLVIPVIQLPTFLQLPVKIDLVPENIPVVAQQVARPVEQAPVFNAETAPAIQSVSFPASSHRDFSLSLIDLLLLVYAAGVALFLLILARHIASVLLIFRRATFRQMNGYRLYVFEKDIVSFAFGRSVVISCGDYDQHGEAILAHEQAHIRLNHFYDLVLVELVRAFHWFNPAIHLLISDLKAVHEFQADAETLKTGFDSTHYQLLVIQKGVGQQKFALANSFNHCQIKKRIVMMNKLKNTNAGWWKAAAFLPLLALLLVFCGRESKDEVLENAIQMKGETTKLDQCFILFDSMTEPYKFEMNLVDGSVDEKYNFADISTVKQLVWLSFKPKHSCWLTDGEYKYSSLSHTSSPFMSFSGKIRLGNKEMEIKGGTVDCKQGSREIKVSFNLEIENGIELKGSYSGQLSKLLRIRKSGTQPLLNAEVETEIVSSDDPGMTIVFKSDGNYINNRKYSREDFIAKVKEWRSAKPGENRGLFRFSTYPGVELSEERNREISAISNAVGGIFLPGGFGLDQQAVFPGGVDEMFKWIDKNKVYPKDPKTYLSGKHVGVKFEVDENGKVGKIEIVGGVNSELDAEVIRVISQMPTWKPAMRKGKPVSVEQRIGVSFRPK